MEDREVDAIIAWLAVEEESRAEAERCIRSDPLTYFVKNLDFLPPHLLTPFARVTSRKSRGRIARIRLRRRNWSRQSDPEELGAEASRRRDPLLYKSIVLTLQRTDSNGRSTGRSMVDASVKVERDGVLPSSTSRIVEPPDVEKQKRFASIVERLDEEDIVIRLRKQQGRPVGQTDEIDVQAEINEQEEEDSDDEEAGMSKEAALQEEVWEDYIRGNWDTVAGMQSSSDGQDEYFDEESEEE
ncbi:hypothetical protein CBS101457_000982 [Exobasidium rhododendri]|nr:hypothetical protein CBS101457_000982 [Exobasidium rhododendri]